MIAAKVSDKTIRRLSHYARCLRMAKLRGESIVTSHQLAGNCGISSAAVRRDLSTYGEFGKQGSGYNVNGLLRNIENILGTTDPPAIIVVGAGNLGVALVESGLTGTGGYRYIGLFDNDHGKIGKTFAGLQVRSMADLTELFHEEGEREIIAVLTVSSGNGQVALNTLVQAGCNALLSFNVEPLQVPEGVELRYVEVSTELDVLTHSMRRKGVR